MHKGISFEFTRLFFFFGVVECFGVLCYVEVCTEIVLCCACGRGVFQSCGIMLMQSITIPSKIDGVFKVQYCTINILSLMDCYAFILLFACKSSTSCLCRIPVTCHGIIF